MNNFSTRRNRRRIVFGLIVIIIGILFLLGNIFPEFNAARFLGKLWPLILIVIGFFIVFNQARVKRHFIFGNGVSAHGRIIGDVKLDFAGKDVDNPEISQIVGDLTIDLKGSRLKAGVNHLNVSMVIGDTTILVPSNMPLRVSARTILGDIKFDGRREEGILPKLEYVDPAYESSSDKIFITLGGIIGNMTLKRI